MTEVNPASLCQPEGVFCSCEMCWLLLRIIWVQPDTTRCRILPRISACISWLGTEIGRRGHRLWMVDFGGHGAPVFRVQRCSWRLAEKGGERGGVPSVACPWAWERAGNHRCRHSFWCSLPLSKPRAWVYFFLRELISSNPCLTGLL